MSHPSSILEQADFVCELLEQGVSEVFNTIFNLAIQSADSKDSDTGEGMRIAGSVEFIGELHGIVSVYVREPFARTLTSRMLGISETELTEKEMVNDVIGELSNMIVGSVKSRLNEIGPRYVMTFPYVARGADSTSHANPDFERRWLSMRCDTEPIIIELLLKPLN